MPSSVTFERQIEIICYKFRKDAAALAFVDSFEAAIEEIDEWFGVSGLMRNGKLRTLTRTVVFQTDRDLRRRLIRALSRAIHRWTFSNGTQSTFNTGAAPRRTEEGMGSVSETVE